MGAPSRDDSGHDLHERQTSETRTRVPERAPLDVNRIPPSEMVARACEYSKSMSRRRSVRHFSDEAFPLEILDHAIRAWVGPRTNEPSSWYRSAIRSRALPSPVLTRRELDEPRVSFP